MLGAGEVVFLGEGNQLIVQYQIIRPKSIHTGNIVQGEQVVVRNMCVCVCIYEKVLSVCLYVITINESKRPRICIRVGRGACVGHSKRGNGR